MSSALWRAGRSLWPVIQEMEIKMAVLFAEAKAGEAGDEFCTVIHHGAPATRAPALEHQRLVPTLAQSLTGDTRRM
jgi:hypothetical protein